MLCHVITNSYNSRFLVSYAEKMMDLYAIVRYSLPPEDSGSSLRIGDPNPAVR